MESLGLFFLRLLAADLRVPSPHPSPTAFLVLKMKQEGNLGQKELFELVREMEASGIEMLTDGFGGSVLRM